MADPALPVAAPPAPMVAPTDAFRTELLRAAFGPEMPGEGVHRALFAWSRAAGPNTLRALRADLRHIDDFQRARGLPALPLSPAGGRGRQDP